MLIKNKTPEEYRADAIQDNKWMFRQIKRKQAKVFSF